MSRIAASLAAVLVALAFAGCGDDGAEPDAPSVGASVSLVLDYQPNAVHAGIYSAIAEGDLEDEGIDLEVQEPGQSTDAPKLLRGGPGRSRGDGHPRPRDRARSGRRPGRRRRDRAAAACRRDRRGPGRDPQGDQSLRSHGRGHRASLRRRRPAGDPRFHRCGRHPAGGGHDRLRLGGGSLRRQGRRGHRLLERRGRRPAPLRRPHARVPGRRLRRPELPRAGSGHDAGEARVGARGPGRRRSPGSRRATSVPRPTRRRRSARCSKPCPAWSREISEPSSMHSTERSSRRSSSTGPCSRNGRTGSCATGWWTTRPDVEAVVRLQPSGRLSRRSTSSGSSRAIRDRGTTWSKPAASAALRTSTSTCE